MRSTHDEQLSFEYRPGNEKIGKEIEEMDKILKNNDDILRLVEKDILAGADKHTGRPGMSAEQVLRALVVKQLYDFSYRRLYERLEDSIRLRRFCGYEWTHVPPRSTLQENIKKLTPETLEAVNRALVEYAKKEKIETGEKVRIDTTAVETDIHRPADCTLIEDCVRVITRILRFGRAELPEAGIGFHNRSRVVKRRVFAICNARSPQKRKRLYRDLLVYAREALGYAREGAKRLRGLKCTLEKETLAQTVADELEKYAELLERIISQAERRVIKGEDVPANEKVVSIFEEHTDIIVKGSRETVFGHKICLMAGRTSMVLDCTIEKGNPGDVSLYPKMVDRQMEMYGKAPESISADGGFSSEENARYALDRGVKNVSFGRHIGRALLKLLPPRWLHRKLQKFRAGIEGIISAMKRAVGLSRCLWEGWESFKSYVWSCVVAHNLKIMSRILAARTAAAA